MPASDQVTNERSNPSFDVLLRLDPVSEKAYQLEYGAERGRHLFRMVLLGLVFYNLFNITSVFLMPDILVLSVILRLCIVTPGSLFLAFAVLRVSPVLRERLVLGGMLNASLLPIFLFWYSSHPWSGYSYLELPLSLFFGAMVMRLRFHHMLIMSGVVSCVALAAVATKAGLPAGLKLALGLQLGTAVVFIMTAGYFVDRQWVTGFIQTLSARRDAEKTRLESRRLTRLSFTDPLTGLSNRRRFDLEVDAYLKADDFFGLIMVDVDFFKVFNDTQGHQSGDVCLQLVARTLDRTANHLNGLACRIGGEEFALLFACDTQNKLERTCQDLLDAVEALLVPHPDRPDRRGHVTVSAGAVRVPPQQGLDDTAIMALADQGLYQSKQEGRNRFTIVQIGADPANTKARPDMKRGRA